MDDFPLRSAPNPFSPFSESRNRGKRNLFAAAKTLGLAAVLLVLVIGSQFGWEHFEHTRWLDRFGSQSKQDKVHALETLDLQDARSIDAIAVALSDPDPNVAAAGFQLAVQANKRWTTLPEAEAAVNRKRMTGALRSALASLPEDPDDARAIRLRRCAQILATAWAGKAESGQAVTLASAAAELPTQQPQLRPLPLASEETAAGEINDVTTRTAWTDWPPSDASLTPRLYQRNVRTLTKQAEQAVLAQVESESATRIVRPSYQVAETLRDHPGTETGDDSQDLDYWLAQLTSGSRLVRLRAVNRLNSSSQPHVRNALREHLRTETDQTVAFRIRESLSD